jgi:hypothetical protein
MPDNVGYTPGSGATVAADDVGGVLIQRMKLVLGTDGANDGDVSASNPIPTGYAAYAKVMDESHDPVLYVGEAVVGSATGDAVWRIQKIDTTSGVVITWADGDALFDNVWDDHDTTETYS